MAEGEAISFEGRISTDGSTPFAAEAGRYHLYVSPGCPFAHRATVVHGLKGLQEAITMSFVDPILPGQGTPEYTGWNFNEQYPDPLGLGVSNFHELYRLAHPTYPHKKLSVPVLWDRQTGTIMNGESAQISEMFNSDFNAFATNPDLDLNPADLQEARKEFEGWALRGIAFAVYGVGGANEQDVYNERVVALFENLDRLEELLSNQRFCAGDRMTLSDVFMFTPLVRFDPVYNQYFRCNIRRIKDYPNITNWLREVYQMPGVRETVFVDDHIKPLYFLSNPAGNPKMIVPRGPELDWDEPHDRERFAAISG